ncbi:hypothetical protein COV54_01830 [Candidatus Jorgensenbacteria bacterium CG11_big_fil_rev_8_21_14_0_20_38_23]|uniref:Membrane transport protein MMPL domain-containing protein n=1 Tax=Candidatus Jorgensenbacteria bacterium CG11_big_fil_rev_8_21_14_0_20_38_23 TaxID=1974594 RepID=A0A2H0NE49_9BACT|nr:MAG: hypothetical protein COV54_01830 [Candidatus Jorgensenbacteria bacterium CG11_big_fil_rev_8_21_14_0_20_38_23]
MFCNFSYESNLTFLAFYANIVALDSGRELCLFKLFPVTLTLAGIAGFILSIGIAVDANVLIFERMKEEKALGKVSSQAIKDGFARAWSAIRDGNLTTLIVCAILYYFATSMVRGFAVTLGLGIFISLFSSLVITRALIELFLHYK